MAVGLVHSSLLDRAEVGVDPVVEDPRMREVAAIGPAPNKRDLAIRFMLLSDGMADFAWLIELSDGKEKPNNYRLHDTS
ncbi:hypothetical protein GUJ93_ZPchr0013g37355 [Zizania palustris]|uniref:Uncharacterized protein n=1 Tax=Zizania palustris TaxID=103762 RepID=A0A8J5X4Q8_ZIZPA|nr:hypothetical protein GUJ93_ZPchr0013g37355 [Zizania palustris]